jgi:hypothetical protein
MKLLRLFLSGLLDIKIMKEDLVMISNKMQASLTNKKLLILRLGLC